MSWPTLVVAIRPPECIADCWAIVFGAAVAIHWRRQLVYFSTSRDRVHRIALNATDQQLPVAGGADADADTDAARSQAEVIYQAGSRAGGAGLRLSVDWLYDRLYVADQNTVSTSRARTCSLLWQPLCLSDVCVSAYVRIC